MPKDIHPPYEQTTITCACGAVYHVGSTKKNIRVDVCGNCHPVYTGARITTRTETGGRIERFRKKYGLE
ncbi:MAG: 50S ribosomal protein L31 [Firmicutes bacterium]|nr:50S ribosomal protein L31 [Bacillota bacterium]